MSLPDYKVCPACKERKGADAYHKDRHASNGLRSYCKDCHRQKYPRRTTPLPEPSPEGHKFCSHCKEHKLFDAFGKDRSKASGLCVYRKDCIRLKGKRLKDKRPKKASKPASPEGHKFCPSCKGHKLFESFYKVKGRSDGLDTYCSACRRDLSRASMQKHNAVPENSEKRRERGRAAYVPHPKPRMPEEERRKRTKEAQKRYHGSDKYKEIHAARERFKRSPGWFDVRLAFDRRCAYCGCAEGVTDNLLTTDHIIPLSRAEEFGKTVDELNIPENVVPACMSCNRSKWTKTLEEFAELQGFDIQEILAKVVRQ